jgi:hypothetical protein
VVDVTDDHSLLSPDGDRITPKDLSIGDKILHSELPNVESNDDSISVSEARILGFFFGDGSCGNYVCNSGRKSSWALNNADMELLMTYKSLCEEVYPDYDWVIMPTLESSNVYKLSPRTSVYGGIVQLVTKYRELMYSNSAKIIPPCVLNASYEVRDAFWNGMYDADGDKDPHYTRIDQKNQISAACIGFLASSLGYKVSFNTRTDKPNIFRVTCTMKKQRKESSTIKKMTVLKDYDGYVYDLTTSNHHFAAGIGKIVVHNTDSVYLKPPNRYFEDLDKSYTDGEIDKLQYWTKMVEISDGLSESIRDEINSYLEGMVGNTYIKMENEEVKFPVIFTGKKKYAGIAHYHDKQGNLVVDFYPKKLFIKGIDIIKEGQPMLAITIGNRILRSIVDVYKPPEKEVLDIVEEVFNDAIARREQWTMDDFIQSDAFRPLKDNKTVQKFVARMVEKHKAEVEENKRRTERGEPLIEYLYEPPAPGERFKYIVVKQEKFYDIKGKKITVTKGDLMEYVHTVQKLGLEIDIGEYLKSKIAGICARFINYHQKFQPEGVTIGPSFTMKDLDKYCQDRAKKFLISIVDRYAAPSIDHHQCKRVYKKVEKKIKSELGEDTFNFLQNLESIKDSTDINAIKTVLSDIARDIIKDRTDVIKTRNSNMLKMLNIASDGTDLDNTSEQKTCKNVFKYYKVMKSIVDASTKDVERVFDIMNLDVVQSFVKKYNTSFEALVLRGRDDLGSEDDDIPMLDMDEISMFDKFRHDFKILVNEFERLYANKQLFETLTKLRQRRLTSRS